MADTHEMPSDRLIQIIQKLHAKAVSAKEIGSLAEAEIFAAKVEQLLLKHKLSMSDLSFEAKERTDPLGKTWLDWGRVEGAGRRRKRTAWVERLAGTVAKAHFCQILVHTGSSNITFIGRQTDREVAEFMTITLVRLADELAVAGYWKARYQAQKNGGTYNTQSYKTSFLNGFVQRIGERYEDMRKTNYLKPGTALVLQRSRQEVQTFLDTMRKNKELGKVAGVKGRSTSSLGAFHEGRSAANNVNLNAHGLKAGQANKTRELGGTK